MKANIIHSVSILIVFGLFLTGCKPEISAASQEPYQNIIETKAIEDKATTEYYTVQEGDTLFSIAEKFKLNPITLAYANSETCCLLPGTILRIPPQEGAYYRWQVGDTLEEVAARFQVEPQVILEWHENADKVDASGNYLEGAVLFVPDGKTEAVEITLRTIEEP